MRTILITAILSLVALGTAVAGGEGDYSKKELSDVQHKMFMQLDTNEDGVISESEAAAQPRVAEHFSELDSNGDAEIETAEFARFEPESEEHEEESEEHEEK